MTAAVDVPPGAPLGWDRMPWLARRKWLAAHPSAPEPTPEPVPVLEVPVGVEVDGKGRRVWTEDEMRAAGAAARQYRRGRGKALTQEQQDAFRAYQRWHSAKARARTREEGR